MARGTASGCEWPDARRAAVCLFKNRDSMFRFRRYILGQLPGFTLVPCAAARCARRPCEHEPCAQDDAVDELQDFAAVRMNMELGRDGSMVEPRGAPMSTAAVDEAQVRPAALSDMERDMLFDTSRTYWPSPESTTHLTSASGSQNQGRHLRPVSNPTMPYLHFDPSAIFNP